MKSIIAVVVCLLVSVSIFAKGNGPSASNFSIYAPQTIDQTIVFTATVSGLPQNGGATIGSWVELNCQQNGVEVFADVEPAIDSTGWPGESRAFFTLPVFNGQCDAFLFWDGWNNPRHRNTNTLASLHFAWPIN